MHKSFDDMMMTHHTDDNNSATIGFFGNVKVGTDVSLEELRQRYDVVVLAYGCESDRSLSIPGKDLDGILTAREFVAWYNGHVDFEWVGPIVQKALATQPNKTSNRFDQPETEKKEPRKLQFSIKRKDMKHEPTRHCPGCSALLRGQHAKDTHECYRRFG